MALHEHLFGVFLPDKETRSFLKMPRSHSLDMRPACFKTNQILNIGFVSSTRALVR